MTINVCAKIAELEQLQYEGYVFRGQQDFRWQLIPQAFREKDIMEMIKRFAMERSTIEKWFSGEKIKETISGWYSSDPIHAMDPVIHRLKEYCLYLMYYNHSLSLFVQKNPDRVSEEDKTRFLLRDAAYWRQEATFQHMFEGYFRTIINRYSLQDNSLLQGANPYEDLAGVDETLPQHYDTPTAALDWSYNFHVAIHFALGEGNKQNPKFLALYALKILNPQSPIKMIDKNIHIENIRADRQEGTFSYFTHPCSFFLQNECFPSLNYFNQRYKNQLDPRRFELKELLIERTENNLVHLKKLLDEKGINKSFLFPDLIKQDEAVF